MEALLGWDVIGWAVAALLTFLAMFVSTADFRIAKASASLCAMILLSKAVYWGWGADATPRTAEILFFSVVGTGGLLLVSFRWIESKRRALLPSSAAPLAAPSEGIASKFAEAQAALAKEGERYAEQVDQKLKWMNATTALSNEQERLQELVWRIEYDQNRPEWPSLDDKDAELARIEIARLTVPLETLKVKLAPVADDLAHRCLSRGDAEGEFGALAADLFYEQIVRHCQRGFLYVERPQDWQLGPLEGFARWFWGYRKFRESLPKVTLALGIKEADLRGYAEWREADAKLFVKFDDFALPWLREFVQQHRQAKYPDNLNGHSAG